MHPENTTTGDTFSYKGWLNSDSFLKRALAVVGYNIVGGIVLYIPIIVLILLVSGSLFLGMYPETKTTQFTNPAEPDVSNIDTKLDINQICDNSLAYTSFSDGAAADAYLVACKAGNHPEVIEQYKNSLNMEDGTI